MSESAGTEIRTPFVDDALLEQRQQQREVLLSIPKWLADKAREVPAVDKATAITETPTPPSLAQRILIERHARDRIDDLLDQLQEGMVAVIDRGVAETIAAHLVAVLRRRPSRAATAWRETLTPDLLTEISIDEETLGEMIDLLLMADDLANDGFADLRFT